MPQSFEQPPWCVSVESPAALRRSNCISFSSQHDNHLSLLLKLSVPLPQASAYQSQIALLGEQHGARVAELESDIRARDEQVTALRSAALEKRSQAQDLEKDVKARIEQVRQRPKQHKHKFEKRVKVLC